MKEIKYLKNIMKRINLEHIIRASSAISDEYEIVVVGSQSILGEFPNAPNELLMSMEADVYPLNSPEKSDLIDGSIGEYSIFHETYGYYAQGVSPSTSILPEDWKSRLLRVDAVNSVGYCINVHDLAIAKLVANREKDLLFVSALFKHKMVDYEKLIDLISKVPKDSNDPNRANRLKNKIDFLKNQSLLKNDDSIRIESIQSFKDSKPSKSKDKP